MQPQNGNLPLRKNLPKSNTRGVMRIYDVSLPISSNLPIWPGDPKIIIDRFSKIEAGADANITQISMCVHVGTHVDAPFHFLGGDALTVEQLSLNVLTGRAYVLQLTDEVDSISADVLERAQIPPRTRRLLFKSRNSALWLKPNAEFKQDFVAISANGAEFLVEHGIRLVGVDYLSVAPFSAPIPTHRILLQAGITIIEGLDLSKVSSGRYSMYCLPLKIVGADGAPARVILVGV
jgi:arylformamidase